VAARVQCDEIWAFIDGKDKNLAIAQRSAGAGSVLDVDCAGWRQQTIIHPRSDIAERKPQRR
jgi:hypothetical protein